MIRSHLTARVLAAVLATAAALALAACGSDDEPEQSGTAAQSSAGGAFPATVEHRFGTTTVEAEPERIVVVGLTEQDVVLQLGHKPIATTEWYGNQPYAVWPWAQEALGDAKPTVLNVTDGFEFEKIAELAPDLIIGTNSGMQREDYDKFSQIAPTLPGAKGATDYFSAWDQQTLMIAQALGKPDEGEALVQRVKDRYAQVAEEHPEFAGKTATFSQNGFYEGLIYVYPDGLNTEFLTYLGFEINPKVTALVKKPGEQVAISAERLDTLEADVIVFATEKPSDIPALEKVPTFNQLGAVRENRSVYTDGTLAGAIYFMTPLSLEYVLDRLTPQLQDAVDGKAPRKIVDTTAAP
jgi:iron complex transport system substrate-binding protein